MVYSTDRSKSSLTLVCLVVYSTRRFVLCHALCYFVLVFFSPFSITTTSLGEMRARLGTLRTFVRFAVVWFCLFFLPLGVWKGLWFVIVALPGLFSYPLFCKIRNCKLVNSMNFQCGSSVADFHCSHVGGCLGRAAACDCGTPWTFLLVFHIRHLFCH